MLLLVRSFQIRGHYMVKLDPLGINDGNLHVDKMVYRAGEGQAMSTPKFLDYKTYGFTEADLHKEFFLNAGVGGGRGGLIGSGTRRTLKDIVEIMQVCVRAIIRIFPFPEDWTLKGQCEDYLAVGCAEPWRIWSRSCKCACVGLCFNSSHPFPFFKGLEG